MNTPKTCLTCMRQCPKDCPFDALPAVKRRPTMRHRLVSFLKWLEFSSIAFVFMLALTLSINALSVIVNR